MSFKEAIREAITEEKIIQEAFSDKNLEKVAKLLADLASKKLPTGKFVPFLGDWYEDEFIVDGLKGKGYRFLSEKGYMIRFGFINPKTKAKKLKEKFVINRVDFWEPNGSAKINKPSKSIILEPWLNIVEVVDEIFSSLNGNVSEAKIDEANLPKKLVAYAKYKGVDDNELANFKSGATLVKFLKNQGVWDDEEYKGFKVTKGKEEKDNPQKDLDTVVKKVQKVKYADPKVVFKDIEKLTKLIALDVLKQNGLIITGAPGMGKTFGMEKQLKELFGEFNQPDSKVVYLKGGSISTFGLYKFLYRNRNDKIIVLDDSDALLKDKAVVNMLKSAMDSYPVRELSWESNLVMPMGSLTKEEREEYYAKIDQALEDPQKAGKVGTKLKMPGSFPFTSKIFFISNMTTQEWQKDPHIAALWSRSAHIDVNLSREGIKERILSIIDDIEPDVPREIKEELLEKMYKEGGKLNIRVFAAAAQMRGAAYKGLIDLSDEEAERFATQYI
jgi:Cdc6-like AAA superfamily ATPase